MSEALPQVTSESVRATLIDALEFAEATDNLDPKSIKAFLDCEHDFAFSDLELDSLQLMELMVALETEHDVVVAPYEIPRFASLGELAAHVQARAAHATPDRDENAITADSETNATVADEKAPPVIRLFRRAIRSCRTAASLNRAMQKFEHKLTPQEVATLSAWNQGQALMPAETPDKLASTLSDWLNWLEQIMKTNGKTAPEPFVSRRLAPAVLYFEGTGPRAARTLVVCFPWRGGRRMMIPHAALLQNMDASRCDVMIIADTTGSSYRRGLPFVGRSRNEVFDWITNLEWFSEYAGVRTMGCSSGGYPAVLAAYRIKAEIALSLACRFPSDRQMPTIIAMMFRTLAASIGRRGTRTLLAHSARNNRDRRFAARIALLTGGQRIAVHFENKSTDHHVLFLQNLLETGELQSFLDNTLFSPVDTELTETRMLTTTISFPTGKR